MKFHKFSDWKFVNNLFNLPCQFSDWHGVSEIHLLDSTSKEFLLVREDGSRQVKRNVAQQMEFNSRLLKLNDDADIMEELKGLTPEQLKALIAMVKNA